MLGLAISEMAGDSFAHGCGIFIFRRVKFYCSDRGRIMLDCKSGHSGHCFRKMAGAVQYQYRISVERWFLHGTAGLLAVGYIISDFFGYVSACLA